MSNNIIDLHKLIENKFKDYRASGIALSITLITLSSGLIVWASNLLASNNRLPAIFVPYAVPPVWAVNLLASLQIILLSFVIFSCLLIQFANYQGHKHEARSHLGQSKFEKATYWFNREDVAVYVSLISFGIGVVLSGYLFFSMGGYSLTP